MVGVGLINGSFALALKGNSNLIFGGSDLSDSNLEKAKERGVISHAFSLEEGIKWADCILIGTPVDSIKELLPTILDRITKKQFVVDFGSTKASICETVKDHPNRAHFLALLKL